MVRGHRGRSRLADHAVLLHQLRHVSQLAVGGEPSEIIRLFLGVNAVGLWDELFFICTVFALLRRHFRLWQANILQAIIFVSFLWELGYTSWGPFLTTPFALIQGYLFNRTRSLPYVLCTHLIFDCVLWAVLLHAHNPGWLPIFIY